MSDVLMVLVSFEEVENGLTRLRVAAPSFDKSKALRLSKRTNAVQTIGELCLQAREQHAEHLEGSALLASKAGR